MEGLTAEREGTKRGWLTYIYPTRHVRQAPRVLPLDTAHRLALLRLRPRRASRLLVHGVPDRGKIASSRFPSHASHMMQEQELTQHVGKVRFPGEEKR